MAREHGLRWVLGLTGAGLLAALAVTLELQLFLNLTIAGLTLGSIAALSGLGIVVTYKATGVFNFAHGAIAVFVAYVLWQVAIQWGVPLLLAAPLVLLVVGPGLGALLERIVFRPLSERDASAAEELVATIGVFVVLLGAITATWGTELKTNPAELFPSTSLCLGACGQDASGLSVRAGVDQLGTMLVLAVASAALVWLFTRSRLGLELKAVVDRRELAQLTAVNANRVSAIAWGLGAGFAGLTGVLLAPAATGSLDPFRLTLLVIETFAVAVVARLTSLPLAIGAGLGIGLGVSYLTQFSFAYVVNWVRTAADTILPWVTVPDAAGLATTVAAALDPIITSMPVFVLLAALLLYRELDVIGGGGGASSFVARVSQAGISAGTRASTAVTVLLLAVAATALPFAISGDLALMRNAHQMLALAVIFLSIVIVTGFSGHITLAQAGFAGLGALTAARLDGLGVPVILAMVVGGLVCIPIGLIAGYPALRRRGLFLGLTTLALGLVLERGVLQNTYFVADAQAGGFDAPVLLGLDLGGDVPFYFYELGVLVLMVLLARNLRRGRLGRILGAMRDSEVAARSVALNLRTYKLFIFSVSAFMAGIGGALYSQASGAFSSQEFITLNSLLWFAVVVVAGVASIYGALLGAFLFTLLGALLGEQGLSTLIVGVAAVSLGRLPGGLVGAIRRIAAGGPGVLLERADPTTGGDEPRRGELQPTRFAEERLSAVHEGRGS